MSLFEPYRPRPDADAGEPSLDGLVIRPATPSDTLALGAIEAQREGGTPRERASKLERTIASCAATGEGLVLVATHAERPVGIAKVRLFHPPEDAPANVAPAGWYLSGVIVAPRLRRRGIGMQLTSRRLDWIAQREPFAYYFANARNRVSIELHRPFGFVEITRDFTFPGATFEGGAGILYRADLGGRQ
jgi:ribosomal protein S18 acetylase RimI-like enzyme